MARRLIFASVPVGVSLGRSGYCTVAKSAGLSERICRDLERISAHEPGEGTAFTYRRFDYGNERLGVITRYIEAGPDYTGRASTLADHLILDDEELSRLGPPADIARRFTGWTDRIPQEAAVLPDSCPIPLAGTPVSLPALRWKAVAGDAGKAALFCDDQGRARVGVFPAPSPEVGLELMAESSLLTDDRGTQTAFDTRTQSQETGFTWKTSDQVSFASLRDPGIAPRAVLARSGVIPGARPRAGGMSSSTITVQEPSAKKSSSKPLILAGSAVLIALTAGVVTLALKDSPPQARAEFEEVTAKPIAPPAPIDSTTLREALSAMNRGDLLAAAELRTTLLRDHPEEDARSYPKLLYPLRDRLLVETLTEYARQLDDAKSMPPAETRRSIAGKLDKLEILSTEIGAPPHAENAAELARLRMLLRAMQSVDDAFTPSLTIARAAGKYERGDSGDTTTFDLGEVPALDSILAAPDARFTAAFAEMNDFGKPTEPFVTQSIPSRDFSAGKILAVNHPEHRLLAEIRMDTRRRATLRLRRPTTAPEGFAPLTENRSLSITISDTHSGKSLPILIVAAEKPPTPLTLSSALLTLNDGTVSPPGWLKEYVSGITSNGAKHTLSPTGYTGSPRDHSGLVADRSVIEQALRSPGLANKADAIRTLLRRSDADALARLAPWRIAVALPESEQPLTLVRFESK